MAQGATRREQAKNETHRLIAKAAIALFNKKGYEKVTVNEICKKAGMAKGTFYAHFKSKDYIITEEFIKSMGIYMQLIKKVEETESYGDKMAELLIGVLQQTNDTGVNYMKVTLASQLGPAKDPTIQAGDYALYQIVEQLVAEAQEKGKTRTDISARKIARIIVRSARGITYEWCRDDGNFDLVEAGKDLLAVLIDGLKP